MSYRDSYSSRSRDDYRDRGDRDRDYDRGSSSRHRDMPLECKVYVGDLPERTTERDIHEHFERCGHLKNVWVARNPPGFAFVEFTDPRDAEDAVRRLDGISMNGSRIRVEASTGQVKQKSWNRRGPPRPRRAFNPDDRCFECRRTGHYAYDCPNVGRRGSRRSRSRSTSRGRYGRGRRSYSRSRSRSRSASRSRSRSRSNDRRRRDRSRSRSASHHSHHSHHSHDSHDDK